MKRYRTLILALLVAGITAAALAPTLMNGFVNLDDNVLVYENQKIMSLSPAAVRDMFASFYAGLYHPLVLLSYAVEYHFFQLDPSAYHATNLALHLANVLLVFWIFFRLSGSRFGAAAVALLFGIHPMHVESVAWISERKDVLYAFFYLGAIAFYMWAARESRALFLILAFFAFILSLLSKPMAVTLPFVLVLLDCVMGLPAFGRRLAAKIPFFAVAAAFIYVTMRGQHAADAGSLVNSFVLFKNALIASHGLLFYVGKLVCPYPLACLYPAPAPAGSMPPPALLYAPAILLFCAAGIIFSLRYTRIVLYGILFYVITILPVINLVPVGLGLPADRYTYIPYLGLFAILAAGLDRLYGSARRWRRAAVIAAGSAAAVVLAVLTWQQSLVWKNDIALYTNIVRHYRNVPIAWNNRGFLYICRGEYDKALADCREAARLNPRYFDAENNLGNIYLCKEDCARAEQHFRAALALNPSSSNVYVGLGNVARQRGRADEALRHYHAALAINPKNEKAHYNIGWAYEKAGDTARALDAYGAALEANPRYLQARETRGDLFMSCKNYDRAVDDYSRFVDTDPGCARIYSKRARANFLRKEYSRALADAQKAQRLGVRLDPQLMQRLIRAAGGER